MRYLVHRIGSTLAEILSGGLLLLVYVFVVTPLGLMLRLVSYDPLKRHTVPSTSNWTPCTPATNHETCFRQS